MVFILALIAHAFQKAYVLEQEENLKIHLDAPFPTTVLFKFREAK